MIALVRVSAPPGAESGTVELNSLPEPPGSRYTAFAVQCQAEGEAHEALLWYRTVLDSRPSAPLGLIARETDCIQAVADLDHSLEFFMNPRRLNGEGLPASALQALRDAGIEGRMLEEIVREHGREVLSEEKALRVLISRAAAGGSIGRAASDLGVHQDTLVRRLDRVGLSLGPLKRRVRVRAYGLRVEHGVNPSVALLAGGWTNHEQRRKTMSRLRERASGATPAK